MDRWTARLDGGVFRKAGGGGGILEERHDLPVFVADTAVEAGQLQGIPVPSGTDLHEASRRLVLRNAKWKLK